MHKDRLLIRNAEIYQPGSQSTELKRSDILIEGNQIIAVGQNLVDNFGQVDHHIDASGKIVFPGFSNSHDHTPQTMMKNGPQERTRIDDWISRVARMTEPMDPQAHYLAAKAKFLELALSGVTTTADMVYIYPNKYPSEEITQEVIRAAGEVGIKLLYFRGSMSLSKKDGAEFPDDMVENSDQIITRTAEVINRFHQDGNDAMVKIGIAPCTILTSTPQDYRNAADLARSFSTTTGVRYRISLQTHLSESRYEHSYVAANYHGMTPLELLQSLGWGDEIVSFVHCIEVGQNDINLLAQNHSSVCHCPISNSRSPEGQQGIAPIWEMLQTGVNISIGVDGSAGNNSGNIVEEMRWAMTIAGARQTGTYLQPWQIFDMATVNGAKALNWPSIGQVKPGFCADIVIYDIQDSIAHLGTWDPAASLISCQALPAETVIVNGKIIVSEGKHTLVNQRQVIEEFNAKWKEMYK